MIEQRFLQELGLDAKVDSSQPLSGGDTALTYRVETDDLPLLIKTTKRPRPGMFQAEAASLNWLSAAGLTTPRVISVTDSALALEWISSKPPTRRAAVQFGRELAAIHSAPIAAFGIPPPNPTGPPLTTSWVGNVPTSYGSWNDWATFYSEARLLPLAELASQSGAMSISALAELTDLAERLTDGYIDVGPPTPPSRIHGDLWSGNLLWRTDTASIIDPAAHGGHPETDLAMLALFPPSALSEILAGYQEVRPLDDSWHQRIPLHQLLPLLVHTVMFGGGYSRQLELTVTQILATAG